MRHNIVQFVVQDRITEAAHDGQFLYKQSPGILGRLQSWAFRFLRHTSGVVESTTVKVTYHTLDIDNLLERIWAQVEAVERDHYAPERILIGSVNYMYLMREIEPLPYTCIETRTRFGGLEIEIVPNMDGIVVIPRKDEACHIRSGIDV